ncbi:MAG: DNA translocase FtsK, partial [Atopobiaceae bacterium]|nr:DNA translocase FtsK [Atopobiaceae bacterium]
VVAIALILSLMAPTSALVTQACADGLRLSFGAGAILVPIALLLFSFTFFVQSERPISLRTAFGLALVVTALLAVLSINVEGGELDPSVVLTPSSVAGAGGYVGGAIAWVLLSLLGRSVGIVFLVGLIITGIIICGFSISGLVARMRIGISETAQHVAQAADEARELRAERAEAARLWRLEQAEAQAEAQAFEAQTPIQTPHSTRYPQAALLGEDTDQTSYLGARKTTILKRDKRRQAGSSEPQTTLLKRGRQRRAFSDPEEDDGAPSATPHTAEFDSPTNMVPNFLSQARPEQGAARKKRGSSAVPRRPKGQAQVDAYDKVQGTAKSQSQVKNQISSQNTGSEQVKRKNSTRVSRRTKNAGNPELPPMNILESNPDSGNSAVGTEELDDVANHLQATLEEFGLQSQVVGWVSGPSVTTFRISMGEGERVSKITNLEDDIALSLAAVSVRIFAPIPGTSLVGIEIPNERRQDVRLGDVLPYAQGGPLDVAFGRNAEGKPVVVDLAGLPHLLVAGATGSGKSVFINSVVSSILMRATPEQVRLIMIDPKRVEFGCYAGLPHLYVPVVTEPKKATSALQWGVTEMERRLKVFEHYKVRDIASFNQQVDSGKLADMEHPPAHMPFLVIVIDELSDLMMVAGKDVEASIVRIAQLGRAAGIHLIVATQRPSADVVTGLIKANIDNRVALSVDSSINSRVILDKTGAERLLGKGDMLYKLRGTRPLRAQSCWVSDPEIEQIVDFIKEHHEVDYHEDILTVAAPGSPGGSGGRSSDDDPLLWEAARLVVDSQLGSTSSLQRSLSVGYARAGRIMDMLEQKGVVGPANGSKPRDVLIDAQGLEDLREAEERFEEV